MDLIRFDYTKSIGFVYEEIGYPHPGCEEFSEPDCFCYFYIFDFEDCESKKIELKEVSSIYKMLKGKEQRIALWTWIKQYESVFGLKEIMALN